MRGWIGAIIASTTVVLALAVNPANYIDGDIIQTRIGFAILLLCCAGIAFLIAKKTPELLFSRHVTIWVAGFAVLAIGAANIDILTGSAKGSKTIAKSETPEPVKTVTKIDNSSNEIYVPDTSKLNRVEKLVTREAATRASKFDEDEQKKISNIFTSSEKNLPDNWKLNDEQKQKFEAFLATQGLEYDPETAFNLPADPDDLFAPSTPDPANSPATSSQSNSPGTQKSNFGQ